LRSAEPPAFRVPERSSKLEPFKDEIHRLLSDDPKLPGVRVRELIEPLGFAGGKTIVDDYLRMVRPMFARPRTHQRTVYRPGEICQWDLWEPDATVPPVPSLAWMGGMAAGTGSFFCVLSGYPGRPVGMSGSAERSGSPSSRRTPHDALIDFGRPWLIPIVRRLRRSPAR
jgi:hypothetical protein